MPTSRNHQPNQDGLTVPRLLAELQTPKAIILWSVPILLTIWVYYGKQAHFKLLANTQEHDLYSTLYEYTAAFLLMFFIPALIAKVKFGKRLRDLGIQPGNVSEGIRLTIIALPLLVGAAWLGSADAAMQAEYPLAKSTMQHLGRFAIVEVFYLLYYCSWEFLFRGFMLFGLQEPLGTVPAILIQTIPSAIVHIGKPASESFAAILAGVAFGYIAVRTRSILYPTLLHAVVGIATDVFVTVRLT